MRHTFRLVVMAAAIAGLAALAATNTATRAQDAPEPERFVVFESFGDTG